MTSKNTISLLDSLTDDFYENSDTVRRQTVTSAVLPMPLTPVDLNTGGERMLSTSTYGDGQPLQNKLQRAVPDDPGRLIQSDMGNTPYVPHDRSITDYLDPFDVQQLSQIQRSFSTVPRKSDQMSTVDGRSVITMDDNISVSVNGKVVNTTLRQLMQSPHATTTRDARRLRFDSPDCTATNETRAAHLTPKIAGNWQVLSENVGASRDDMNSVEFRKYSLVTTATSQAHDQSLPTDCSCLTTRGCLTAEEKSHRPLRIKLYDGTTQLEGFHAQFNIASEYNNRSNKDRLAQLKLSLTGQAMNILWEYTPVKLDTVDKVIQILMTRYGNTGLVERYRMELRTRRRQRNETLPQLLQDIQRLTSLAFPGPSNETTEIIARDAYIDALNDSTLAFKIREREPRDLEEAHKIAMR
jgi:hypothetical protein